MRGGFGGSEICLRERRDLKQQNKLFSLKIYFSDDLIITIFNTGVAANNLQWKYSTIELNVKMKIHKNRIKKKNKTVQQIF